MKKCIYCSIKILDKNIIDFCDKCGVGVFGEKMFNAIKRNMEEANEKGDLTYNSPNTFKQEKAFSKTDDFGQSLV